MSLLTADGLRQFVLEDADLRGPVLGVVPLATGLLSTCPLYSVLGFNTCPMKT